jgi:hypothetical protein
MKRINEVPRSVVAKAGEWAYGYMLHGAVHTDASIAVAKGWMDGYTGAAYDPHTYNEREEAVPMSVDVVGHYALYYAQAQGAAQADIERENEKRARQGRRTLPFRFERVAASA